MTKIFMFLLCAFYFLFFIFGFSIAQEADLEFTLDATSNTIPLPKIFKPNIDLSGRGFHRELSWPQTTAAREVLDIWQKEIGFNGLYRLQYNLWEISQLSKNRQLQDKLLKNYEEIIKSVSSAGGVVILDIFGTPAGMGRVLDKKSPPRDLKAFKGLVKNIIEDLSCKKKYNIWYEAWSAPDLDDFFLGRKQEYLNLFHAVADSIKELRAQYKIHIPLGGPSVSWWFQNPDGNTIVTPEKSLIYELIRFCYQHHLPLDFISWHGYSSFPAPEKEATIYKKSAITLIRDWLTYFHFDCNIPLIVDEWNYDRSANVLPERNEKAYILASYIPSRIKNMYEAGLDNQVYFCLEDFQANREGVVRNVGVFTFDPEYIEYKGAPKAAYNAFKMFGKLGSNLFAAKFNDDFVGVIPTKSDEGFALIIYNYIDPEIVNNYLSGNIANLNNAERKSLLNFIKSKKLDQIMQHQLDISALRLGNKVKTLLKKTQELNDKAQNFKTAERKIKINLKNLKENYSYQRYVIDSSCSLNCKFLPVEEKDLGAGELNQETLTLSPYSVQLVILKQKPKEPEVVTEPVNK
jgi:hypothetical protein